MIPWASGSKGGNCPAENITLNFAEFKLEYTSQKADGSASATNMAGWNIAKNVKA